MAPSQSPQTQGLIKACPVSPDSEDKGEGCKATHTHTHTYANIHTPDTDINYHRVNVQVVRLQSVCVQLFICLGTSQNAQMFVCNCKCQSSHVFQNELSTGSKHKKI